MEGLLSLLLFAGAFYLMMRFGCGAHMVHGAHGGHGGDAHKNASSIDPVCGMEVGPDRGYTKMHENLSYRFCSRDCLDKFEADPDKYTSAQKKEG
ncbi:MAG: YHS domain-containing protein [Burkholderiales bacterium]